MVHALDPIHVPATLDILAVLVLIVRALYCADSSAGCYVYIFITQLFAHQSVFMVFVLHLMLASVMMATMEVFVAIVSYNYLLLLHIIAFNSSYLQSKL